jgi:quinol monooxygenase YgiN
MYAVEVTVSITPSRAEEAVRGLHEHVVPATKQSPGFVRGTWYGDRHSEGHAVLTYDSQETAEKAAAGVTAGSDDAITIESVRVFEVQAEV